MSNDNGFDAWIDELSEITGKTPTTKMVGYLRVAFEAGHTRGVVQTVSATLPTIRAALDAADAGRKTFEMMRGLPDELAGLVGMPVAMLDELRGKRGQSG